MRALLLTGILLLLLFFTAGGRSYSFRQLSTENGLLSDYRLTLTEDRYGRIWIGSDEGVNVFDGNGLISYSAPDNSGLLHNNVGRIFCDKQGTIWIATPGGIQYRRETDAIFRLLPGQGKELQHALFFEHAPGGGVYIATPTNCFYIDARMKISRLSGLTKLFSDNTWVYTFYHLDGDRYIIGFGKKMVLVDMREQQVLKTFNYRQAWAVAKINDSLLMAGSFTRDSMVILNMNTGASECINDWPASDGQRIAGFAATILPVGGNRFAVASRLYGVYIIDVGTRSATCLTHDPGDAHSIASRYWRSIFVSGKGMLFVHTRGLSYTTIRETQFGLVTTLENAAGEKYDGGFTSFAEAGGSHLWIGTNSFLANYDRLTGKAEYYPYYDPAAGPQKFKTIRAVLTDDRGRPWAGSFGGGMGLLQKDKTWKRFVPDKNDRDHSIPSTEIHAMVKDAARHFIICTNAGFALFDPLTEQFTTFYKYPVLKSIARNNTYSAFEDRQQRLWLAQSDGLYCYDKPGNKLTAIKLPQAWSSTTVQAVAQDAAGLIYAGGIDGLLVIDPVNMSIRRILDKRDGLSSNNVFALLADNDDKIWILGNRGLARYDPASRSVYSFGPQDGVEQTNHGLCNFYKTSTGEILAGSFGGFNYFYPQQIHIRKAPLAVFTVSAEVKDTLITLPLKEPLHLQAASNTITFSYLAPDYNPASIVRYRYRLKGFDSSFIIAGTQRKARYTNLPAGSYEFIVQATTNGVDWYSSSATVPFTVARAFYRTWWFRGLAALLVIGSIVFFYRRRILLIQHKARRNSEYEIKLNELENSSLRTQMNPHFIFNSLNTINAFISSNDKVQANQYISKFSKLIRLILDHSRQRTISLTEELEALDLYVQMELIRFDHKFEYKCTLAPEVNAYDTEIPSLIFQPFVENAILHGLLPLQGKGYLHLSISRLGNALFCVVEDNGIGRKRAGEERRHRLQHKKSHGLDITLKRMELFNKEHGLDMPAKVIDLYHEDGSAAGTRVEIVLSYTERF